MIRSFGVRASLAAMLLAGAVAAIGAQTPAKLVSHKWMIDGVERTGLVASPAGALPTAGAPLVFVFHGHGGTSLNISRTMGVHTNWPDAIVIYLQGLPAPGIVVDPDGKLPGWQGKPGALGDRDLKLFDSVLVWAKKEFRVDPKRIYAAGHSNGGLFTYVLWAARGDVFAAVAPASAVFGQMISTAKPKSALIIAGEKDTLVPYAAQIRSLGQTLRLDHCDTAKVQWAPHANLYHSPLGVEIVAYVHPGGHPLPPDAGELVARFFKTH